MYQILLGQTTGGVLGSAMENLGLRTYSHFKLHLILLTAILFSGADRLNRIFLRPEQMIQDPETGQQLIYDAFVRDGWLYMVSTFYHYMDDPHTIVVDGLQAEAVGVNEYEPVVYYRLHIGGTIPTIVSINGDTYTFPQPLDILDSETGTGGLAIATLFKHDHTFIPDMLDWYRGQGVSAFYMYFNGPVLPPGLPQGPDIHYRLWNFRYWNPGNYKDPESGWVHAAQTAFLTMVRLRHMPDHAWTGLVDIDEVVASVDGRPLVAALADVSAGYTCMRIQNHWAFRAANRIIYSLESTGPVARTKCFYRSTYDALCGIHGPKMVSPNSVLNTTDLRMLHIVNQTHSDRISLIRDPKGTLMLPQKN
jgi:hypothetical protein